MDCRLRVNIISGHNLKACDLNGKSDPFVKFTWRGKTFETSVIKCTLNPVWSHKFVLPYNRQTDPAALRLMVYDWDRLSANDFMGTAELDLLGQRAGASETQVNLPVRSDKGTACGYLIVGVQIIAANSLGTASPTVPQIVATGVYSNGSPLEYAQGYAGNAAPVWSSVSPGNGSYKTSQFLGAAPGVAHTVVPQAPGLFVPVANGSVPAFPVVPSSTPLHGLPGQRPKRRALLIGINYPKSKNALKGCVQDVFSMRDLLHTVYDWNQENDSIRCLYDEQQSSPSHYPTKKNIFEGIRWLMDSVAPGDILVFQFSGHGTQMRDVTGVESDGMDEMIVPADAKESGYIADNLLHELLAQPLPSGARLTAVMDCCHSGTGMDLPFIWEKGQWIVDDNPFFTYGDVQLFSGCCDSQVSYDSSSLGGLTKGGAMTKAFIGALKEKPYQHTFRSLIADLQSRLEGQQRPQLSASQQFYIDRPFDFTTIVPNSNPKFGRCMTRINKLTNRGEANGTLSSAPDAVEVLSMIGGAIWSALH